MEKEKLQKQKPEFDMKKEPKDFAVVERELSTYDAKRYNPAIVINTKRFRAPDRLFDE